MKQLLHSKKGSENSLRKFSGLFLCSKKGIEYLTLMIPVLMIVTGFLIYEVMIKVNAQDLMMGEYSTALLSINDQASKDLLFLDFVVEKAARNSLHRLAQNNGLPLGTSCGTAKDYKLWNDEKNSKKMCTKSIHENYAEYLNIEINKYLPEDKKTNFEFYITDDSIRGIALENWHYSFFLPEKKVSAKFLGVTVFDEKVGSPKFGEYLIKPSFKVDFPNEMNNLEKLRTNIEKMAIFCSDREYKTTESLENCTEQFPIEFGKVTVQKTRDNNVFYFDVSSDMSSLNEEIKINFKFAMQIPWKKSEDEN